MRHEANSDNDQNAAYHDPFLRSDSPVEIHERHLPHWQLDGAFYFVTWRLTDSLPQDKLRRWRDEKSVWLENHPYPWDSATRLDYRRLFPQRIERWLDQGYGSCHLRDVECSQRVAEAILHFDHVRYDIGNFVVMPNHVHTLFQLRGTHKVEDVLGSWKGYSAAQINKYLGRSGALWQQENWDRLMRSMNNLVRCFSYIKNNPAEANINSGEFYYFEAPDFLPEIYR
tara:strand:- start:160 stop:840 length:681 start_codon:yes stop_codon:yes gene_type:complete